MTLGEFIQKYRTDHGLSQRQFAVACDLSNGYISMLERGKNPKTKMPVTPTLPAMRKIAQGMNISLTDLFVSVDDMPVDLSDGILPLPAGKAYPLLGDIACGTPILAEENISEYIQFPGDLNADFCLRCKGDSMIEARIHDGDIVFIRQQPQVDNGEIAAVLIGEETTLKRVYRTDSTLTLMAANSTYAPMVYTGDQLADIRILGKAVSFLSSVK